MLQSKKSLCPQFLLVIGILILASCTKEDPCDDCTLNAVKGVTIQYVDAAGNNLFFGQTSDYGSGQMKVLGIDEENNQVEQEIVIQTDRYTVSFDLTLYSTFYISYGDNQDTLMIESRELPSCGKCSNAEITKVLFNGKKDCEEPDSCTGLT